jgi:hypothetical protein
MMAAASPPFPWAISVLFLALFLLWFIVFVDVIGGAKATSDGLHLSEAVQHAAWRRLLHKSFRLY